MAQRITFRRAAATSPGKHGPLDWRVTFRGYAPEHAEIVFMVGMLLLAEDRYNAPGNDGRYRLWYFLDRLLMARSPERIIEVAQDCHDCVVIPENLIRRKGPIK